MSGLQSSAGRTWLWAGAAIVAALVGGWWVLSPGDGRPRPVVREQGAAMALSDVPFAELDIPPSSRPGGQPPADTLPLPGPFTPDGTTRKGKFKYTSPLPFRTRGMYFTKPSAGVALHTADGTLVRYEKAGQGAGLNWAHDRNELTIFSPTDGPPTPGQLILTNPVAAERERALNLAFSPQAGDKKAFVWTEITDGWDTRSGLLLPAPGKAAWDVTLPPAAELTFVKGLVEPEILTGEVSDGATLVVEVEIDGAVHEVFREPVALHAFEARQVDLSRWAGRAVRLRMRSEPGATSTFDYVFAGAPLLASRVANPIRVVMVYLDTLRPDHLGIYGYERDTSAMLDEWAKGAAVFTNARTIAPWTLPSARALITGQQPEDYPTSRTLPEMLHTRGFSSAMIAGNVYLMANFKMQRGWDLHRIDTWPPADEVTDAALDWLRAHDGRDQLLQVQYMSAHLPYVEPDPYLHMYTGDVVPPLPKGFLVQDIRKADVGSNPEVQQYIIDRYDGNIRFLTDSVRRIVDELDDNDYLLIFSDHGEELWDHDGFEHGHTLYDELLRIPLIISGPGIAGARIDAPVSLIDLTPTILELLGEPVPDGLAGRSLVPLLRGDPEAPATFAARDQAFGRPLYGFERWGVLHADQKWTIHEGNAALFDLTKDAAERKNLLKKHPELGAPFPGHLSGALGRDVVDAYRLLATAARTSTNAGFVWVLCSAPGGFSQWFVGNDAMENSRVSIAPVATAAEATTLLRDFGVTDHPVPANAGAVQICWESGWSGTSEAYLVPTQPRAEVDAKMVCSAFHDDARGSRSETMRRPTDPEAPAVVRAKLGARSVNWTSGTVPTPAAHAISGRDSESTQMLIELGYLTPEQADQAEKSSIGCQPLRHGPGQGPGQVATAPG